MPLDFPPFGSVGADMKPAGYDIDMALLLAQELGVKLEMVPVTTINRLPYLTEKKVDLIVSSLGKSPEREKVIDFSASYAPFFIGVFGTSDQKVEKAEDLAGKTIGVTRGGFEDSELIKVAPKTAIIQRFEDNDKTLSAFLSGNVPLIVTGNVVAANISDRQPHKRLDFKFFIKNSPCFVGVNKGEARLLERVNTIIAKSKADGSLNRFGEKWMKMKRPVASFL